VRETPSAYRHLPHKGGERLLHEPSSISTVEIGKTSWRIFSPLVGEMPAGRGGLARMT